LAAGLRSFFRQSSPRRERAVIPEPALSCLCRKKHSQFLGLPKKCASGSTKADDDRHRWWRCCPGLALHWLCEAQRFDLRFLRCFRADLSIKKSSSFFPPLIAATSQFGFAPRPAQVSPDGPRYFGGTFLPFKTLAPPPRTTLALPTTANIFNCFSSSARRLWRASSTRFRRSISASTVIPDRFTFAIVISGAKTV